MMLRIQSGLLTVNRLFVAVLFAVFAVFAVWVWLGVFDNQQPSLVDPRDRTVVTPEVYQGGKFKIHVISTPVRLGCETRTTRILYDGNGERKVIDQPTEWSAPTPGALGVPNEFTYGVTVPIDAAKGHARYVSQTSFRCTTFQRWFGPIVGELVEQEFEIIPRSDAQQKALEDLIKLLNPAGIE